jgi:hypothetical protein
VANRGWGGHFARIRNRGEFEPEGARRAQNTPPQTGITFSVVGFFFPYPDSQSLSAHGERYGLGMAVHSMDSMTEGICQISLVNDSSRGMRNLAPLFGSSEFRVFAN